MATNTIAGVSGFPLNLATAVDLALSEDGDLIVGPDGDIQTITGVDTLVQTILFRLKTRQGDAAYAPACGASLDTLIGRPNSPDTQAQVTTLITNALTHDGLFSVEDLDIIVAPITANQIAIFLSCTPNNYVGIDPNSEIIAFEMTLDLQEGLIIS